MSVSERGKRERIKRDERKRGRQLAFNGGRHPPLFPPFHYCGDAAAAIRSICKEGRWGAPSLRAGKAKARKVFSFGVVSQFPRKSMESGNRSSLFPPSRVDVFAPATITDRRRRRLPLPKRLDTLLLLPPLPLPLHMRS